MLTEQQCKLIETALTESVEPRKVAAYLCLHMGLTLAEVTAIRWQDIDLNAGVVTLRNVIGRTDSDDSKTPATLVACDTPRALPSPPHVIKYLRENSELYQSNHCFVLTGETELPVFHYMQNVLTSIRSKYNISDTLSATDLRNAFIRRCIENDVDLYTICEYVGIKQPNVIVNRFKTYFTAKFSSVSVLKKYSMDYQALSPSAAPKRMNLLILGAGSQGPVVKEIAEAIGVFHEIAFLDDNLDNKLAIGPLSDYTKLVDHYPLAIPSFGDSALREKHMNALEALGYIVPTLVHPAATISPSAKISRSVVIEARSIVSAGAVLARGALISSASVIEVGARVGQFAHVGSSVTVSKNVAVPDYIRVPAGSVIRE